MTADDIADVQAVEVAAGERFRSIDEPRIAACADHPAMPAGTLGEFVDAGSAWVATEGGEVVGFLVARVVDGCAHIEEVAVAPEHGGRGHATALLDAAAEWARSSGRPAVTLTTFRDVPWNRPIYERRGFRVLAEGELSDELRALQAEEDREYGLPVELRVVMRHDLQPAAPRPHIRSATRNDLPAMTRLFNALIPTTTVAWRDDEATAEEMSTWFDEQHAAGNPVLVAEADGGDVVGYTTWSTFRGGPRFPGYRHTVELTIHVDERHHARGIGRALIDALVDDALRRGDIHVLVAGIDAENTASIAFHERLGFTEVARMPEVGRKFDRWLDLVLMQRTLT